MALFLLRNNIIENEKISVYEYGFEVIISTLIGFLLVFISGVVLGELASAMIFYGLFVVVRLFTGGYHADSHIKCKLTLLSLCLLVLLSTKYFIHLFSFGLHLFFLITYFVTVFLFAPIEHKNAPLTDNLKNRNKKISVIIAIILTAVNILCYVYFPKVSIASSFTLFIIAILIILPIISRKEDKRYEKNC